MAPIQQRLLTMAFSERLTALRRQRKFTQQVLADKVGVHLSQIRRCESGETQPILDVIRKLAIALSVSEYMLIFDTDERGVDDELRLQFEALRSFTKEENAVARSVSESLILKHDSSRFTRHAQ
ncbi:MAG: helix-turn-helix transcriptional regulator [Gammaproteobacteria bacterium]|nr:helix-turn-helix transcriptional regulator [Gammaproteobacteria bacterium]